MYSDEEIAAELAEMSAMRRGEILPGIDPFSAEGKLYLATMDKIRRDLEHAPKLSMTAKTRIAALLKGGAHATGR